MKYISFLILLFVALIQIKAQELNATVSVTYEQLPSATRDNLDKFQLEIERYLNETRFTGANWDYAKIDCQFNILFTGSSDQTSFQAQVIVSSLRQIYNSPKRTPILLVNDNSWSFKYERNVSLVFDPNAFNSVTSLLDYYAFVIIGLEQESWEKFTGTQFFNKAIEIANLSRSSNYNSGWVDGNFNRKDFISDFLNEKYRPFREAFATYHYGIDLYEKDKVGGQKEMAKLVYNLFEIRSKLDVNSYFIRSFFDAKSGEIIDRLGNFPDKKIWEQLKKVDSQRQSKYDEILKK